MIVLAGFGFVGKAYYNFFKNYVNITVVDPKYNNNKISDTKHISGVIICVPTPESSDGSCDISYVYSVMQEISETVPVMIKSTISLEGWDRLEKDFPNHKITFSPEFLRAATADKDVRTTAHVFLAGGRTDFWRDFYSYPLPEVKITICNPKDAIAIKYFRNSFLATKCSFFNEMYDFCQGTGIDYDCVRYGVTSDPRIGESHSFVFPESRGWGGFCFPKDTAALLKTASNKNINLNTLDAAVKSNNKIRKNN